MSSCSHTLLPPFSSKHNKRKAPNLKRQIQKLKQENHKLKDQLRWNMYQFLLSDNPTERQNFIQQKIITLHDLTNAVAFLNELIQGGHGQGEIKLLTKVEYFTQMALCFIRKYNEFDIRFQKGKSAIEVTMPHRFLHSTFHDGSDDDLS
jgi:hypothetical protein